MAASPRGALRLLVDPVFGWYFLAQTLSTAGIWVYNIVAAILVYNMSGSTLMVGLVSVAQFGPQLLFAPISGAMADRGDRRAQLIVGKLLVSVAAGSLAGWIFLVGIEGLPGVWPVIAVAFIVGLGLVLIMPALNALIPALVHANELAPAVALNSVPPTIARAGGPAVGAVAAATLGPAQAFAIAAIANLLFVVIVITLKMKTHANTGSGEDQRIRAGVLYLRKDRRILPVLIGVAAVGIGADPVITLTPSLASTFGSDPRSVGYLASAFGIGAGVCFLTLGMLRRRIGLVRLGPAGLLTLALGMVTTGVASTKHLALASLLLAGTGMTMALTALTTQLQAWAPDHIRGRILALWSVAFLGSRPLAAAVNGAVADAAAPSVAFSLVALVVASAAWQCRPAAMLRREP